MERRGERRGTREGLRPPGGAAIGVGTTIGAGIVVLPGQAAAAAGPVVAVPFVAGVVSVFTALSTVRGYGPADAGRVAEGIDCPVLRPSGDPVGASGSDADD
jgi:hypothetical protein